MLTKEAISKNFALSMWFLSLGRDDPQKGSRRHVEVGDITSQFTQQEIDELISEQVMPLLLDSPSKAVDRIMSGCRYVLDQYTNKYSN